MQADYDLLIAGGGLAGLCLAYALKDTGLQIAIVEASPREQLMASPAGDRALALAAGTVKMLAALGMWQGISHAATAIKQIHISDQGHFGKARLSAAQENVPALGYVISARDLETHAAELVAKTKVEILCPMRVVGIMAGNKAINISLKQEQEAFAVSAKLLVGADGGSSSVRKLLDIEQQNTEYGQTALVTTVTTSLANAGTAYERFTSSGPLALLPVAANQSAVVWTRTDEDAESLMAGGETDFIMQLQECFGYKLGELSLSAPRRAFPLSLIRAEKMHAERAVIIGNAVHQLHPVAGQGFNLGLRDVVLLAEMLINQQAAGIDIGAAEVLNTYATARQKDHDRTIAFTDNVVRIFSNDWLALAAARSISLAILDHMPFAKNLLARHAMGLAGRLPRLGSRR